MILFHLNSLHDNQYNFQIQFDGIDEKRIQTLQFFVNTFNPKYTQFELTFRFIFLIFSTIITASFVKSIRNYSLLDWSLEQKWLIILLVFLIFYNNPLYPFIFLYNKSLPLIIDTFFQTNFFCVLLFFWLAIYHGIRQNTRRYLSFYLPKIILICLIWIFSMILSFTRLNQQSNDPTIDLREISLTKMSFYLLGIVYIFYLVFLILRAYGELQHMPFYDVRLKFHTILMFSVLLISISTIIVRFNRDIFDENFISAYSFHFQNSLEFILINSLANFYLYTMAYVYLPGKNAQLDSLFNDNPTFSMINDFDEDIIYD